MESIPSFKLVAGVDEAGRGPLAGPVTAAAVILKAGALIEGLKDSKRLSAKSREILFDSITANSISVSVGIIDIDEIDRLNILNASLKAMRLALNKLVAPPDVIYVDGNRTIPGIEIKQYPVIRGDSKIPSIMAASIIAKVTRDRIMVNYSKKHKGYGFERHKGYPTREHLKALKEFGPCPIHRRSFAPVREIIELKGNN